MPGSGLCLCQQRLFDINPSFSDNRLQIKPGAVNPSGRATAEQCTTVAPHFGQNFPRRWAISPSKRLRVGLA